MPTVTETSQFATDQVARLLDRLEQQIAKAAESHGPEEVHDLRVAIRRLTQALVTFKRYFPGKVRKELRGRLRAVMKAAGPVRDSDIALKFLLNAEEPDTAELRRKLRAARKESAAMLDTELIGWRRRKGSAKPKIALLPARPPDAPSHARVKADAADALPRVAKRFFKAGSRASTANASATDIHQFRIQAKKFRYTIELFQPVYGATADRWLKQLKEVQTLLGDINDCRVMRERFAGLGASASMIGRLKKRQRKKTAKFEKLWDANYGRRARRSWIREMQKR
jgi:CHAD domain-containing protein